MKWAWQSSRGGGGDGRGGEGERRVGGGGRIVVRPELVQRLSPSADQTQNTNFKNGSTFWQKCAKPNFRRKNKHCEAGLTRDWKDHAINGIKKKRKQQTNSTKVIYTNGNLRPNCRWRVSFSPKNSDKLLHASGWSNALIYPFPPAFSFLTTAHLRLLFVFDFIFDQWPFAFPTTLHWIDRWPIRTLHLYY